MIDGRKTFVSDEKRLSYKKDSAHPIYGWPANAKESIEARMKSFKADELVEQPGRLLYAL